MSFDTFDQPDEDTQPPESDGGSLPWKLIGLALAVAALIVFFVQNGQRANVDFLIWGGSWPVWAIIGVSVLLGMVIDRLGGWALRRGDD